MMNQVVELFDIQKRWNDLTDKQISMIMKMIIALVCWLVVLSVTVVAKAQSPITIQPPVGLPSYGYTNPSTGALTVVPPVGLPTMIYPSQMPSSPVTVQPPVGLPTYIYGTR